MQLVNIGHIQLTVLVNVCFPIYFPLHTLIHTSGYTRMERDTPHKRLTKQQPSTFNKVFSKELYKRMHANTWLQNTAVIRCIIATCRKELGECRGLTELTSRALYHCSVKKFDAFFLDFEWHRETQREMRDVKASRWEQQVGRQKKKKLIDSLKRNTAS